MKNKHREILDTLVETFHIPLKFIDSVRFGEEYNIKLSKTVLYCEISLLNHVHAFKTLTKTFSSIVIDNTEYQIKILYLGEFLDLPASKSYLCKRTEEELEKINLSKNPCLGCDKIVKEIRMYGKDEVQFVLCSSLTTCMSLNNIL